MNKKGHRRGGTALIALSFVIAQPDIAEATQIITGIYFGSFLPDLDAEYSYFRKVFKPLAWVYDRLPKHNKWFKHRGLFLHSFYTLMWIGVIYAITDLKVILWVILGVIGHHILDSTTKARLKYF